MGRDRARVRIRQAPKPIQVKQCHEWKPGYRQLTARLQDHPNGKAIRFRYFEWLIWIVASGVYQMGNGNYITTSYLIDQAKQHPSAKCGWNEE